MTFLLDHVSIHTLRFERSFCFIGRPKTKITLNELSYDSNGVGWLTFMFTTISLIGILVGAVLQVEEVTPVVASTTPEHAIVIPIEEHVSRYFEDVPVMSKVAYCESTFRQFGDDGNVLRGIVDSRDVGVMQINEYYHLNTAEKLGLNIHTLEGNMTYARYLYDKQGLQPWAASRACWDPSNHIANK